MNETMLENPSAWSEEELRQAWLKWIDTIDTTVPVVCEATQEEIVVPKKRILVQAESHPEVVEIFRRWRSLGEEEKQAFWQKLKAKTLSLRTEIIPVCVQCGECCKNGSPVLCLEDLELLKGERLPWDMIFTIRQGEPVIEPQENKTFCLVDDRLKIREKSNSKTCIFWDEDTSLCTIYDNRPIQCRAQACWDPKAHKELEEYPYLTRRDLFSHIDTLWELINEHNKRCSFEKLHKLMQLLGNASSQDMQKIAEEIINLVSYEQHFRDFVAEELNIPYNVLDLVFGRPLKELLKLFAFELYEENQTRYLKKINI